MPILWTSKREPEDVPRTFDHCGRLVPVDGIEIECVALHIPTGTRHYRRYKFVDWPAFYRCLAMWNSQQPGTWQYFE